MKQLTMFRPEGPLPAVELPEGWHVRSGRPGDGTDWCLCCRGGRLGVEEEPSEALFDRLMLQDSHVDLENVLFIEDEAGTVGGTTTLYLNDEPGLGTVHMVGVKRSHQGKGLSAPVVAAVVALGARMGRLRMRLTTDDFRVPAVKTYLKLGFLPKLTEPGMRARWEAMLPKVGRTRLECVDENDNPAPPIEATNVLYDAETVCPGVTRISMPGHVFSFLIEGADKALLVDTGYGIRGFKDYVNTLTAKPYEVLLTHMHGDHAAGTGEFESVWVHELDLPLAARVASPEGAARAVERLGVKAEDLVPPLAGKDLKVLAPGQVFDLGDVTVEPDLMPGHTPGSLSVLIREARTVITGDACNSMAYLQLATSTPMTVYRDGLRAWLGRNRGRYEQVLYSHPHNFGGPEIIDEMLVLAEKVLKGTDDAVPYPGMPGVLLAAAVDAAGRRKDGRSANMLYRRENRS